MQLFKRKVKMCIALC